MRTTTYTLAGLIALALLLFAGAAFAWTGPTGSAPSNNVAAPINVGSTDQVKNAAIGVNGLAVFGNSLLQASSYLNWGSTAGTSGYGIRDNSGTLEFKNTGGSWQGLQTIVNNYITISGSVTGSGSTNYVPKFTGASAIGNSSIYDNGNVGIGTTNPSYKFQVQGASRFLGDVIIDPAYYNSDYYVCYYQGYLRVGGSCSPSDARLKTNIENLADVMPKLLNLRGVTFEWKDKERFGDKPQIGMIAQEVEKEFPQLVTTNSDGFKSLDYQKFTAVLLEGMKEQQKEIDELKSEVKALQNAR